MEISGKKAFVTGGAGFIGSHLSEYLLRLGSEVTVFDNFDDFYLGKEDNIVGCISNPRFHLVRGDILDYDMLAKAIKGSSVVFHLAAQPGVRYSLDNPRKAHEVNATGTLNVLQACKKAKVTKLVYASSSSIYGNAVKVPISEGHPSNPTNPYGVSKLSGEKYCISYHISYDLPVTCLRYFSVYGPRGRPDQVLYSMALRAAQRLPPEIFGAGDQRRDFTFVSDIVSGTIMAALRDDSIGEVFNLGYGEEFSIMDAARRIINHFDLKVEPLHKGAYSGDFDRTLCDNTKAKRLLGWNPRVNFGAGLDNFLEWFEASKLPLIRK